MGSGDFKENTKAANRKGYAFNKFEWTFSTVVLSSKLLDELRQRTGEIPLTCGLKRFDVDQIDIDYEKIQTAQVINLII